MHASRHDLLGNPVTLADAASLGPLNDFVEGFIACEARVVNVLQQACTSGLGRVTPSLSSRPRAAPR